MPTVKKPASEESKCDALVRQLGGQVVQFGQKNKRARNTIGVPDRLYFVKGHVWWFEVKTDDDRLSSQQILFLTLLSAHGQFVGVGNRNDLCTLLNAPHPTNVLPSQITKYSTRQKALRGA